MKLFHTIIQKIFHVVGKHVKIAHRAHSQPLSFFIRKTIAGKNLRQFIGVQLASMTFIAAVIIPGVDDFASQVTVMKETVYTVVESTIAESKFRWPLAVFSISQHFSLYHPGMDLTDPRGTPIHPVADGKVIAIQSQRYGYGNSITVEHADGVKSLYAHLSVFDIKVGDKVTKDTTMGEVGSTGWSTGNHLHLEIYQNNAPVNPLEVLPEISKIK